MTQPTNELMYEVLKNIQSDVSELKQARGETREGFASLKSYLASFLHDQAFLERRIADLEAKMDRVTRRLNIKEDI